MILRKNAKDLTGQRFGRLVAVEPMDSIPGKGVVWYCKCDCGGTKAVPSTRLLAKKTQSCGCIKRELQEKQNITGKRFGRLVAVEFKYYNDKHEDCWLFKCDCGNEKIMPAANVKWCRVRSCGCLQSEHIEHLRKMDITNQRFGRLTAIRPTPNHDSSGSIIWECKCDCGSTVFYSVNRLTQGRTLSCGCLYRDTRGTCSENRADAVEGTLLSALVSSKTLHANNSSGHTGVYLDKRTEKWQAYINFQKKRYHLGMFKTKEQAIRARKSAEKKLFDPLIQERWDRLTEESRQKYLAYIEMNIERQDSEMKMKYTDDFLMQMTKAVVLDELKNASLTEKDGVYSFEVAPIPGDKLTDKEAESILTADVPETKLLAIVGGRYFDVIDATEQNFNQICIAKVQELVPDLEAADIMDVLNYVIRINPPIAYYVAQLSLCGEKV